MYKGYTEKELINNVCEKNTYRSSKRNHEKLKRCGIKDGERIALKGNYSMSFYASHSGITKKYYWGNREVSKDTIVKRVLGCFT